MKRKITSFILLLAMLVSIVAVLPIASAAADTTLKGTDVTLTDGILLNFYVEADDTLGIDNAEKDGNYYVLTVDVAAKEMGDDVTAEFKAGSTVVGSHTYSVADYAAGILDGNYDAETKALVTAMLNYGAAAQKYFKYETDALVGTPVTDTTALEAATVAPVAVEGDGFIGASLVLEGTMTLRFYFAGTVDSATVDGEAADVNADAAEYCYVDVKVTPDNIDKAYTVVAGDTTVTYSVLNYLQRNADNAELAEMVASIYAYGVAADAYVSSSPIIQKFDGTSRDIRYEVNVADDVLNGKHFYPDAENGNNGRDLFVEFSLLWNETLANSAKGWAEFARFHAEGKLTSYDSAFWFALKDDCSTVWCQEAGGFEYGSGDKVTYGPAIADGGEFPFIGEYGWHRIGIQIHQEVASVSGTTVKYKFISTLYVDGVKTSVIEYADVKAANRLFTAEVVDGELVYSDIDSDTTLLAYRVPEQTVSGGDAYFVTKEVYITAGDSFVLDIEPVTNPEDATLVVEGGVELDAKKFYQPKTTTTVKFDGTSRDIRYEVNVAEDVLNGKHFYPNAENGNNGRDLFVEFSLLWNETLANSAKGWAEFARFHAEGKLTSYDSAFWFALKDDCSTVWCQEAGGFEYGSGDKVTYGPAIADGGEFPFIGEYGWHRIGIQIHQEVASVSGTTVKYKFTSTLYVDGVKTSVIEYADVKAANRLFTAEVVDGELVYSDIDSDTTLLAYRVPEQTVSGGDAYFVTKEVYITAGDSFVLDVEPVTNPAEETFEVEAGVELDGSAYYKLAG